MSKVDGLDPIDRRPIIHDPTSLKPNETSPSPSPKPTQQTGRPPFTNDGTGSRASGASRGPELERSQAAVGQVALRARDNWAPVIELATVNDLQPQDRPTVIAFKAHDADGDLLDVAVTRATFRAPGASAYDSVEATLEYQSGSFYVLRFVPKAAGEYAFSIAASENGREAGSSTTVDFRVRVRTSGGDGEVPMWQVTPLWVSENEHASKGATEAGPLLGIKPGATELKSDHIAVTGKAPYEGGRQPSDAHETRTYYHDSFTQSVLYHGLQRMAGLYDSFELGMKYGDVVAAKSRKTHAVANANAMEQLNAYYMPTTEATSFGVAIEDGKPAWDLGADSNVALHEAGHYNLDHLLPGLSYWGDAGALHEGYGDAQAAFLTRDPEIAEDFSKVMGAPGEPLRNVVNDKTFENTSDEVHDRGKVFGGLLWELGEHLHEALTGKARTRVPADAEALDADAAHAALKILWTFPIFLGSRAPTRKDFVRALHQAVDSLASAGKLPAKVDIKKLHGAIDTEAAKRGFSSTPTDSIGDPIPLTGIGTGRGPEVEGLRAAGLDPRVFSATLISEVRGPQGEVISRYEVSRRVNVEGRSGIPVNVPIEDDVLTVIRAPNGAYSAQVGLLRAYREKPTTATVPVLNAMIGEAAQMTRSVAVALPISQETLLDQLRDYARGDLARQLNPTPGKVSHGGDVRTQRGPGDVVAGVPGDTEGSSTPATHRQTTDEHLVQSAQDTLQGADGGAGQLVWRRGVLSARLELGTLTYYAAIAPDGTLGTPVAEKAVICGAAHWHD